MSYSSPEMMVQVAGSPRILSPCRAGGLPAASSRRRGAAGGSAVGVGLSAEAARRAHIAGTAVLAGCLQEAERREARARAPMRAPGERRAPALGACAWVHRSVLRRPIAVADVNSYTESCDSISSDINTMRSMGDIICRGRIPHIHGSLFPSNAWTHSSPYSDVQIGILINSL